MTGTQILAAANTHTEGDTISDAQGLALINECILLDLGKDAKVTATALGVPLGSQAANTWAALPAGLLEIFEIAVAGQDTPYYGEMYGQSYCGAFDIRGGYIRFPVAGEYTLQYYALPTVLSVLTGTPAINALFHAPMALYVASRYKSYDDEENKDAQRLMGEYQYYKQKALTEMQQIFPSTRARHRIRRVGRSV